jgi:hypothetical protein
MKTKAEFKSRSWMQFKSFIAVQSGMRLTFLAALVLAFTGPACGETQPAAIPFADIGAKATADYHGDALGIMATPDGARLRCGFQKLEGHATREGLWLESTEPGAAGKLRLTVTTLRREDHSNLNSQPATTLPATGTVLVEDKLVRFTRPGVTEEYSVSVDGVRQDFVIAAAPAGAGDLHVELALSGARAETAAYGAKLTLEGSGRVLAYNRLRVEDAVGHVLSARLEVDSSDRLAVCVADATATYPVRIDPTFCNANWVSLNAGIPGADHWVNAIVADGNGNVYAGGDFTFIGTVPANHIAKWNGSTWSALGSGMNNSVSALAVSGTNLYAGGGFTMAGGTTVNYIAKWNGSTWSALGSGITGGDYPSVTALVVDGTNLYAGGYFTNASGVPANCISKWDGSTWSALGSGIGGSYSRVYALAMIATNLYAGGSFTYAGGVTANGLAKWNGSAWSGFGWQTNIIVYALVASGSDLYIGGSFTNLGGLPANNIAKWNGSAWSALGLGMNSYTVYALAVNGTNVYAGAWYQICKWNGTTWSAVGSGFSSVVFALAMSGGDLYAGGGFSKAGGVTADFIAKWGGSNWSALGSGFDNAVLALAVSGTNLYAGGYFTTAGGVLANYVARWNGSTWSALGSGMNNSVSALAVSGTNLYAGGGFTMAGGTTVNYIAKWNGSTWSALGSGTGGSVSSLAVIGTNLYAGGGFDTAGGVTAKRIAKWDGSAWSALGSGIGSSFVQVSVSALAVSGTNLYAGGFFTTAGGVPASNIAKWNGISWSPLGSGMNDDVRALAVSGTNLYAGGFFTTAGGVSANYIAKWNGSAWSALGSGVYSTIGGSCYTLAVSGTDLYAGGWFTDAGGVLGPYIAKWDGSTWSPLKMNGEVSALTVSGTNLYVGGRFSLVGNTVSAFIAQANLSGVPSLSVPPQSQTAGIGTTVDFTVDACGDPVLTYQWFFNRTNPISWRTNSSLVITNVQFAQSGTYTVVVTNIFGSATSSPAILNVIAIAPFLSASPTGRTVGTGTTVDFSASADGSLPLSYQWFFNDTNIITGATNSVLHLANVQFPDAGAYTIIVTNAFGAVTSAPAMLFVPPPGTVPVCTEEALRLAMSYGGLVTFDCDGAITLAETLTIASDTILDGSGHQVTISGGNTVRVFYVATNLNFKVVNLTIANGRSDSGAGIFNNGGTVTATNCHFVANLAQGASGTNGSPGQNAYGGAVYNSGVLSAINCMFHGNSVVGGTGGFGSYNSPLLTGGAGGVGDGGAICSFGALSLTGCTLATNSALGGAGGVGRTGQVGGYGGTGGAGGHGNGGALFNGGSAYLVNNTVALNTGAGGQGGAGGTGGPAGSPDYSGGDGGNGGAGGSGYSAIYDINSQCYLTNCTVALNWATNGIGGFGGQGGCNCQFPGEPRHTGRGGSGGPNGTAVGGGIRTTAGLLVNTLLSANAPSNCSGTITDAGHNLSSDTSCGFTSLDSMNNTDPKLGPLADNGGPTLTMALLPGSPAIDAGDNASAPPTDQRGAPRPAGLACDIGAYEYDPLSLAMPPPTQTAEAGAVVNFAALVTGFPPPTYQWFFNGNALTGCTNSVLWLSGIQASNVGAYTLVVSNATGAITSAPAMLNVIPAVARRPVLGVRVTGQTGSLLNVDYANALSPSPDWTTLGSVSLTGTSEYYFDLAAPLPPQRFYRAWQTGTPSVVPSLNLNFVPAITLTGNVGDSLRLDYINAMGPTDAWVTLATVTLTNSSQLYFDVSAPGQPRRLYRIVPAP